jgi:hypothetical protein
MLAMLWLYCDSKKSIEYFKRILVEHSGDSRLKEIISLIEEKVKSNKLTH